MSELPILSLIPQMKSWLEEDDLGRNLHYLRSLPQSPVEMHLKFKSDLILAGTDYFAAVFVALGLDAKAFAALRELEGKTFKKGDEYVFTQSVPFNVAVSAERLALNLVQHASSIATWTQMHVKLAEGSKIKILDTRKTTPGLRTLEKYSVRVGGGFNHRLGQTDTWMIKDNHKSAFGGLKPAVEFFVGQGAFYNNLIVEIHSLDELKEAASLRLKHLMLDNFTPAQIKEAVKMKTPEMTFEISGGIRLETIRDYLIEGVDALSIGALTYSAPRVDLSLKFKKK
jgi:nicotinate-nucleotide pyrophosphorylase (carboxylating)